MKVWFSHARVVRQHLLKRLGADRNVLGLPPEELEKPLFPRKEAVQKSWHVR
jgi:hypothetical protein